MSTLREVANRAGVSLATASRVASGSAVVRPETREKVERAMRELLYVAPGQQHPTGAIGLLVPEFANPVFAALAQAMEARATRAGLATILCNTGGSVEREVDYVHMLLERRVDGMLFICSEVTDMRGEHSHYAQLVNQGARIVFVNSGGESLDVTSVGVDEWAAGRIATEHLLELGHTRVGFVAGEAYASPTRAKAAGRREALRAAGLHAESDDPQLIANAGFTVDGGRRALRTLFDQANGKRPTGVICSNDLMAIGVLQEAAALGLRVPDDLSVVGFDGIDAATWTQPTLTTVAQPIREIAETAISALRAKIDDGDRTLPSYVFRPRLRRGGTTAPPSPRTQPRATRTSRKSSNGS
jgi:DNA-binding LacI/PurR family transcriptional regulator